MNHVSPYITCNRKDFEIIKFIKDMIYCFLWTVLNVHAAFALTFKTIDEYFTAM